MPACAQRAAQAFRETILPIGEALRAAGLRFPIEIGRLGAGYYAWSIERFTQLEAELRAELSPGPDESPLTPPSASA